MVSHHTVSIDGSKTRLDLAEACEPQAETRQQLADPVVARRTLVEARESLGKASKEYGEDVKNMMEPSIETLQQGITGLDAKIVALIRSVGLRRRPDAALRPPRRRPAS